MSPKSKKRSPSFDEDDKKQYHKMMNKRIVQFRITLEEKILLDDMIWKEGWQNVSAFVRYKLFGTDTEDKVADLIKSKDTDSIVIILKNAVLQLVDYYDYFMGRYRKDMNQLYKEEGVNMKKWADATNLWHTKMTQELQESLKLIRRIANELKLDEYFIMPSDSMKVDLDNPTTEEMEKMAEQLRKERLAMGRFEQV